MAGAALFIAVDAEGGHPEDEESEGSKKFSGDAMTRPSGLER
jgi:hypothetical protein